MRKFIMYLMVMMVACASLVAGCGGSAKETAKEAANSVPADIKAVKDRGVLKAGVKIDVPKFGYKDPKTGKIEGFEVDIVKALAKKIVGDENKIELQGVSAKTRGALIDNGELDVIVATVTITDERKKSYNFSDPYYTDGVGFLVKKAPGFKSLKDLDGKRIGVTQGTTTRKAVQEEANKLGIKVSFLEFGTFPEAKAALDSGRVDCFSVDVAILSGFLDDTVTILPDHYSPQPYGTMVKKSNEELAKLIADTIAEMKKSGEMDQILQKWGLK